MKKRIITLTIAIFLIVAGTTIISNASVTKQQISNNENTEFKLVINYYLEINVTTDKQDYLKGELVSIIITNVDELPMLGFPYLDIYTVSANDPVFWARPTDMPDLYTLNPGDSYTYTWNQKDMHENQVDAGEYMVLFTLMACFGPVARNSANFMIADHSLNDPPNPPVINGPTSGKPNKIYTYQASTTDPNNDQIYYMFNWGEEDETSWLGPFNSGDSVEANHAWNEKGTFEIKIKAKDINGEESDWSDPLKISITRSRNTKSQLLLELINQLLLKFQSKITFSEISTIFNI